MLKANHPFVQTVHALAKIHAQVTGGLPSEDEPQNDNGGSNPWGKGFLHQFFLETSIPASKSTLRAARLHRGTYRYPSQKDPRTELRMRMREIAAVRLRYGYRKILVLLQREGWAVGKTMISRLYREEGLALRRTVPRKWRVAVERQERPQTTGPNQAWSMDFVSDQTANGQRFRVLTVVDVFTRECLAINPGSSLGGADVVNILSRIAAERGAPKRIHCDNGSEFVTPTAW